MGRILDVMAATLARSYVRPATVLAGVMISCTPATQEQAVTPPPPPPEPPVISVVLSPPPPYQLQVGREVTITASATTTTPLLWLWQSQDTLVARAEPSGRVLAVAAGSTNIVGKAYLQSGTEYLRVFAAVVVLP